MFLNLLITQFLLEYFRIFSNNLNIYIIQLTKYTHKTVFAYKVSKTVFGISEGIFRVVNEFLDNLLKHQNQY